MAGHFTVVVEVKETIEPQPIMNERHYPVKTLNGADAMTERRVVDRMRVVVSADNEEVAVKKAIRMLSQALVPEPHVHRASCDDAGGNHVCGHP